MKHPSENFQILLIAVLTLALALGVDGLFSLLGSSPTSTMPTETALAVLVSTASSTATPSPSATRTATNTPSATARPSATPSPSPSHSPTPSQTATAKSEAPTETATFTPTLINTENLTPTTTLSPTATLPPTATFTPEIVQVISGTTVISVTSTPWPTPTITPTPVPRTIRAENLPDYTQSESHFWFSRPYSDAYVTWGSWYYPYGTNNDGFYLWHHGIDIQNPQNTPILAVGPGVVVFADEDLSRLVGPQGDFYGKVVVIRHKDIQFPNDPEQDRAVFTLYGHIVETLVEEGETVVAGQPIALTGQGGVALGPHLHLEIRLDDIYDYFATQNPDLWVQPDPGYGVIAGRVIDADGFFVPQQLVTLHRAYDPNRFWRQSRTYPDNRFTADPQLGETFAFGDVPVGNYIVRTTFDGKTYEYGLRVENQSLNFANLDVRQPLPTPIPTPTLVPTVPPLTTTIIMTDSEIITSTETPLETPVP